MLNLDFKEFAKELTNSIFNDYYYRLMLIARARFKWDNLPNNLNEKWIERYLYHEGKCLYFKDDIIGEMVAKCTEQELNYFDEPVDLLPVATNYTPTRTYKNGVDCVLIDNNDLRLPTDSTIQLYAYKLAECDRTIDINIHAQKTPVLVQCSEKQRLTLKNVYRQWNGYEPVIFGDKDLQSELFQVLKTDAPIVFDKLQIQKHAIWNECMTFLGINNANMDKRERLVDDEVQANNEQIEMNAQMMLKSRQDAAQKINKMFGTDIKVSLRSDDEMKNLIQKVMSLSKGSETDKNKDLKGDSND